MTAATQSNETQATPQQDAKDVNFDRLRKQLDQERAEKAKLLERVTLLEKSQEKKTYTANDDDDYGDEPYVDPKRLEKKLKKFEETFEKKIDERAEQKARMMLEQDKQLAYIKQNPDFQQVLTQENIEAFAQNHPAIAERMLRMPDNFDRQALLYEQIKTLQSAEKKAKEQSQIQQTIDRNKRYPGYQPSGVGTSPYAAAGDYSLAGQKAGYDKLQELKSRLRLG